MLCPGQLNREDILSIDKAYIDYAKFAFRMAGQKAGCSSKTIVLPPKNTSHRTKGYASDGQSQTCLSIAMTRVGRIKICDHFQMGNEHNTA